MLQGEVAPSLCKQERHDSEEHKDCNTTLPLLAAGCRVVTLLTAFPTAPTPWPIATLGQSGLLAGSPSTVFDSGCKSLLPWATLGSNRLRGQNVWAIASCRCVPLFAAQPGQVQQLQK